MLSLLNAIGKPLIAVVLLILLVIIGIALAISFAFWIAFRHNLRR
jgi:hypothetical protein